MSTPVAVLDDKHIWHISPLQRLPTSSQATTITEIRRLEKKTFPQSEAFEFDAELKKRNTKVLVVIDEAESKSASTAAVGYLVYQRTKRTTLLHKICIAQQWRGQGIGKMLLADLIRTVAAEGCDAVQLWVDEAREPARNLYTSSGFEQVDCVADYYGAGRTGLKMVLRF